jgi:hypothetical protein
VQRPPRRRVAPELRETYNALAEGHDRTAAIARALDALDRDPLASAGAFPGDLIRRLMDLPPSLWRNEPVLYERYRSAVRAAASARRGAPPAVRRGFWRDLPARVEP